MVLEEWRAIISLHSQTDFELNIPDIATIKVPVKSMTPIIMNVGGKFSSQKKTSNKKLKLSYSMRSQVVKNIFFFTFRLALQTRTSYLVQGKPIANYS